MPAQSLQRCHHPEEETSAQGSPLDECSPGTTAEPGNEEVTTVHGVWPQRSLMGQGQGDGKQFRKNPHIHVKSCLHVPHKDQA